MSINVTLETLKGFEYSRPKWRSGQVSCALKKGGIYLWVWVKFQNVILNVFAPERLSPVKEKKKGKEKLTCATAHIPCNGEKVMTIFFFYHIYSYIRKLYTSMLISQIL